MLIAVGLLALHSCDSFPPGEHDRAPQILAAHGPTSTVGGVPVGYTRDRSGAATAAVNVIQAMTQAGVGRIQMTAVEHALIARDPGPGLRHSLDIGTGRDPNRDVVNLVPGAVSVAEQTPLAARVTVWTVAVSRSSIDEHDPASVITAWATHTVSLVWEGDDWKAKDLTSQAGPTPDQTVAPGKDSILSGSLDSGYFSFYVN